MTDKQLNEHLSKLPALTAAYWIVKIASDHVG